jgi:medium-chain acyl-[acyl-carrier-protein] hydrolase
MHRIHRRAFRVHTYDTDFRGRALPASLLDFLQEAAGEHAALLGLSVTDLLKDGLTWVLSRYHLRVSRYPAMGEAVEVWTWPSGRDGFFWLRDFELRDGGGEPILLATSSWVLLDTTTKQPVRAGREIPVARIREERALADGFPRLPGCEAPELERGYRVGLHELDLNDHVNHAVYIRWALETTPDETLRTCHPVDIEVAYRAEAFFGDEVLVRTQRVDAERAPAPEGAFVHGLLAKATGRELTRLRTRWKRVDAAR